ncbi:helix-turn-helix domain-containing protein [Spirillospora sp. CA-294931]|uniref:helix-turn-helix domain-containing protein n=1 Tax=Spirillospora sp. CA-294931 TaxID=3240042 RepID=UPI003D92A419
MSSPYIRRRRLAFELRALRESRGLTADELAARIHQSRVKISKLENAHNRPDLTDVLNILRALGVPDTEWRRYLELAADAAKKGWWDKYGDAMGSLQRIYADIEAGAERLREFQPGVLPGLLQTPEYTWALVDIGKAQGPLSYDPARAIQARADRQRSGFRDGGPHYEVILDEVGLRRFSVPTEVMRTQLIHMIHIAEEHPQLSIRVFPLITGSVGEPLPRSQFVLYTFPDPADPPMVAVGTDGGHFFYTEPEQLGRYTHMYEYMRGLTLSEVSSLTMLNELADEISQRGHSA